jgi:anti-anti-sigma regulatory factor
MAVLPHPPTPARPAYELAVVDIRPMRVSIRAAGELGVAAEKDLARLLAVELATGHVFIRVDLSQVKSLDHSCAGMHGRAHDGCLASHGLLLLEGSCGGVRESFTTAGLERQLFLARTTGPTDWWPNAPGLADLVRREWARGGPRRS